MRRYSCDVETTCMDKLLELKASESKSCAVADHS